jgi:hypothetical protein
VIKIIKILTSKIQRAKFSRRLVVSSSRRLVVSSLALSLIIVIAGVGCGKFWGSAQFSPGLIQDLFSNIFRDTGSGQLTQSAEVTTYAGNSASPNLPSNYREVPDVLKDDDGYYNADSGCASNCTLNAPITGAQHSAFVDCGTTLGSIASRIADCNSKNSPYATWSGIGNGTGGQGTWYLVTRQGTNKEVWQDGRTGLIWSSKLTTAPGDNWCRASGSGQANDPSNYCNNATYQPQYPTIESDCAEPAGAVPTPGWCSNGTAYSSSAGCGATWTANTDNWTAGTYSAAKGGMGANSTTLKVRWRLPTINDYKQADVDGIRSVMPDMGAFGASEWSASVFSSNRNFAWYFNSVYGSVSTNVRTNNVAVRCVGR